MAPAPVYISRVSPDGIGEQQLSRESMGERTAQATQQFAGALGGLGERVASVGQQIDQINRSTTLADRQTKFLTDIDNLGKEFENDADPATAEKRFNEKATKLRGDALAGLRPEEQADLDLKLNRQVISYQGGVRTGALKKQADGFSANVDQQHDVYTKRYAGAQSDTERQAIAGEFEETLKSGVARGMMTAKGAEAYRQSLVNTGDKALIYRQIGQNPAAAEAALKDPEQFKGLGAVEREQLSVHARTAAEQLRAQRLEIRAKTDLEGASFEAGRINPANTTTISRIFDKIIVPQESGGNTRAQSIDGAAGIGQIMPQTARGLAKAMGLDGDWQTASDEDIQARLKKEPGTSRAMGIRLLQDNAKRFDGSVPAMVAAYHANPVPVEAAHRAAIAKYGEGYTAAQFMEMLPDTLKDGNGKTTKSYVSDIYRRMGVNADTPGFAGMGTFRAADIVNREWDRREAQTGQMISELTALARTQADQYGGLLDQGLNINAQRLAEIRGPLELGAARGNAQAAESLRLLNERIEMLPHVQRAYQMTAPEAEAYTNKLRQDFAKDPTPQRERQLKVFEAVSREVAKGAKDAPIQLYERQIGAQPGFVNPQAAPNSPELAQQLQARSLVSDAAFKQYQTRAFFKPEEARAWKERFDGMGESERFDLLQTIQRNTTNQAAYRAAVSEVTGGDKLAGTAGMFMASNPQLARDIMRGSAIAQLDGIKPKAEEVKQALKSAMPGLVYPSEIQSELISAALAVYASERGKNATLYDAADRSGLEAALERVTGKMVTINGRKMPVPAGHGLGDTTDALTRLSDATLNAFGGAFGVGGVSLPAAHIARHGQFVPVDASIGAHRQYMVEIPIGGGQTRPVFDRNGRPLVLDLPRVIELERQIIRPQSRQEFSRGLTREGLRLMQPPAPAITPEMPGSP
jgi:soluble lytic murein transglycosylase-like protein